MSGRFDGNHSTIGNTPKYTPAHDCRSLENAQQFGKSRAVSCRLGLASGNAYLRSIVMRSIRCHAALDLGSELRRPTGPAALLQIPDVGCGHRYVHRQPLRRTIIRYRDSFRKDRC